MRKKYDWKDLKLHFFQSDIDEVKWFFTDKKLTYNSDTRTHTKGWYNEKQAYKEKILQKALEKKAKEEAKNLEMPVEQLKKAKKTVLWLLMRKIQQVIDWEDINIKDQEKILKMIKTELWEPTTISKNDTTFRWEPIDESKFIQD